MANKVWSALIKSLCVAALVAGTVLAEPAALHGDIGIPNMALVKENMREYYKSGRYLKEVDTIAEQARVYLETNLPRHQGRKPAVVLDIDETTLSNYPHINSFDFGYIPKEWVAWIQQAEAPALVGPLAFYRYAQKNGVAVFFITGRTEQEREATERNLRKEGFDDWQELVMKTNGDHSATGTYKAQHRRRLTQEGYTIVVNLGDQLSDLEGGYSESVFKLPNPMYYVP
ncbi:HAD family acid phosphatase [bacterium]|nr:HAD family acid phosphatase [bacterium]